MPTIDIFYRALLVPGFMTSLVETLRMNGVKNTFLYPAPQKPNKQKSEREKTDINTQVLVITERFFHECFPREKKLNVS